MAGGAGTGGGGGVLGLLAFGGTEPACAGPVDLGNEPACAGTFVGHTPSGQHNLSNRILFQPG